MRTMNELAGKIFNTRLKQALHPLNGLEFSQDSIDKTFDMLYEGNHKKPVCIRDGGFLLQIGWANDFRLVEDGMIEYSADFFSCIDFDALEYVIVFTSGGEIKQNRGMRALRGSRRVIEVTDIQYVLVTENPERARKYCLN